MSGSNFLVTLFLVRVLSLGDFAAFSLVFILATLIIQTLRSTVGQTLLLSDGSDGHVRGYFSAQLYVAALASMGLFAVGLAVLGSAPAATLISIATFVSAIQDGLRYTGMSADRWRRVAISDSIGLALVGSAGVALSVLDSVTIETMTAIWGLRAVVGILVFRDLPRPESVRKALSWISARRSMLGPLAGETGLFMTAGYAVNWIVAIVADLTALGLYRAAQVAMNPITTLGQSATVLLLRGGRDDREQLSPPPLRRLAFPVLLLIGAVVAWTAMLFVPGLGALLFGDNWESVRTVVWIAALGQVFGSVTLVAIALIKVRVGPIRAFRFRATVFWVDALLVGLGAFLIPDVGALVGLAAGQCLVAVVALLFYFTSVDQPRDTST